MGVVLLSGCLHYDLEVQFDSQTHGQFVQQLRWRAGTIAPNVMQEPWFQILADRTEAVGGKLKLLDNDALEIRVPFNNGKDLESRFNLFFNPSEEQAPFTLPSGEPIQAELSLRQKNRFVAISNHILLHIDLTAVPNFTDVRSPLLQTAKLLEGRIVLTAPWGVESSMPEISDEGTWLLTAGAINQLEADFWIPSPIGIGALAIALLIGLGYSLKYAVLNQSKR